MDKGCLIGAHLAGAVSKLAFVICIFASTVAASQTTTPTSKATLDPAPWVSPRASGMAGALSTSAEKVDAMYYNPANIHGQNYGGKSDKRSFVHQVVFPRAGVSLNDNALKLNNDFTANSAQNDSAKGAAVIKTHEGDRQYARASFSPIGLFIGNLAVVPVIDQQIAAVPQNTNNSDVEFHYRTFSGALLGSSFSDNKGYLSLGVSTAMGSIEDTSATAPYVSMVDTKGRSDIFSENKKTYTARGMNAGITMRVPNKWNPTLSVVGRDVGDTENPASSGGGTALVTKEDLTAGFGLSPALGKWGRLNFCVEGGYLTDRHVSAGKKLRTGAELLIRGDGSTALLGLRAGANSAGAAFGAHLNIGLIGIEASSHAVDIGINNERVIERRSSGVVYIDVASF